MSDGIIGLIMGVVGGLLIGWGVAGLSTTHDYQKQAIEHGCAGYDRTTGEFQFNMEKENGNNTN